MYNCCLCFLWQSFDSKSVLSVIIATSAPFWLSFACAIFFFLLIFSICVSSKMNWVSCRQRGPYDFNSFTYSVFLFEIEHISLMFNDNSGLTIECYFFCLCFRTFFIFCFFPLLWLMVFWSCILWLLLPSGLCSFCRILLYGCYEAYIKHVIVMLVYFVLITI